MRTWNLRLNLDEFNALAMAAFSDQDRSDILRGLVLGCNAGTPPEQCSLLVQRSFTVGLSWRQEAEDFKGLKALAGKASAEARQNKLGTANPRANREQVVNGVPTDREQAVNQSTIHNPLILNPLNDKQPPTPLPGGKRKRRKATDIIQGFSEDVKRVVSTLAPLWPTEGTEERTSPTSPQDFCQRIAEILEAGNDADVLIQAAKDYISIPQRKYAAPQFFFGKTGWGGKGEAKWVGFVKFILTKREHASTAS